MYEREDLMEELKKLDEYEEKEKKNKVFERIWKEMREGMKDLMKKIE